MVNSVTSLTGNGLRDWLIQRISAVVIGLYVIFLLGFLLLHSDLQYQQWFGLLSSPWMRIASLIVLLALVVHAWIGIWTIITDYLNNTALRLFVQMLVLAVLLSCFLWGIEILWGYS